MTWPEFQKHPTPADHGADPHRPPSPIPPFPQPQRTPISGTAIAAAVLAILGGLRGTLGAVAIPLIDPDPELDPTNFWGKMQLLMAVSTLFSVVLLIGGIFVLMRKRIGQTLVVVGCGAALAVSIISSISFYNHVAVDDAEVMVLVGPTLLGAVGLAFTVTTLVLALLPATARSLR